MLHHVSIAAIVDERSRMVKRKQADAFEFVANDDEQDALITLGKQLSNLPKSKDTLLRLLKVHHNLPKQVSTSHGKSWLSLTLPVHILAESWRIT